MFSHWTGAVLHGLPIMDAALDRVHVTDPEDPPRTRRRADPRSADHPGEVRSIHGLLVTGMARTVVDVAGQSPFLMGVVTADRALLRGLPRALLDEAVDLAGPRRSSARIADVAGFAHPGAESAAESANRVSMYRIGIEAGAAARGPGQTRSRRGPRHLRPSSPDRHRGRRRGEVPEPRTGAGGRRACSDQGEVAGGSRAGRDHGARSHRLLGGEGPGAPAPDPHEGGAASGAPPSDTGRLGRGGAGRAPTSPPPSGNPPAAAGGLPPQGGGGQAADGLHWVFSHASRVRRRVSIASTFASWVV